MTSLKMTLLRHKELLLVSIIAIAVIAYMIPMDKVIPASAQPKYGGHTTGTGPPGNPGGGKQPFPGRGCGTGAQGGSCT
jgi:hypothetical protein